MSRGGLASTPASATSASQAPWEQHLCPLVPVSFVCLCSCVSPFPHCPCLWLGQRPPHGHLLPENVSRCHLTDGQMYFAPARHGENAFLWPLGNHRINRISKLEKDWSSYPSTFCSERNLTPYFWEIIFQLLLLSGYLWRWGSQASIKQPVSLLGILSVQRVVDSQSFDQHLSMHHVPLHLGQWRVRPSLSSVNFLCWAKC